MFSISVVIPCLNEEKNIQSTLNSCLKVLKNLGVKDFEFLVINDGSTDLTDQVLLNCQKKIPNLQVISNEKNIGKGASVKRGIEKANKDFILMIDADMDVDVLQLSKFIEKFDEDSILIASRLPKNCKTKEINKFRFILSRAFNFFQNIFTGLNIRDTQCGFKVFPKKIAKEIFPKILSNGWIFDVELLYIAKKLGKKIVEIEVFWEYKDQSSFRFIKKIPQIIFETIRVPICHRKIEVKN